MKSISEFIMEQENLSCDNYEIDSAYIKEFAEYRAMCSLVDCYTEQALVMEFAEENGISSLNIVMEADNEKKDNIFKKAGRGIKFVWGKLMELIKKVVGKIASFFTHKKAKEKVDEVKKEADEISKTGHGLNTPESTGETEETKEEVEPITDSTPMEEVVKNPTVKMTNVELRLMWYIADVLYQLSGISHGLHMIIYLLKDPNESNYTIEKLEKKYKDVTKEESYDFDFHYNKITFGKFIEYMTDLKIDERINEIPEVKNEIKKRTEEIKKLIETKDENDELVKKYKPYFDKLQTRYTELLKTYDETLKEFTQKRPSQEEINDYKANL